MTTMTISTIQMAIPTGAAMAGYVGEISLGPWAEVIGFATLVGVVSIWIAAWKAHRPVAIAMVSTVTAHEAETPAEVLRKAA
jgi:xanthine/uracil permease